MGLRMKIVSGGSSVSRGEHTLLDGRHRSGETRLRVELLLLLCILMVIRFYIWERSGWSSGGEGERVVFIRSVRGCLLEIF